MAEKRPVSFFDQRKQSTKARRQDRYFLIALIVFFLVMFGGGGAFLLFRWMDEQNAFASFKSWEIWQKVGLTDAPLIVPPKLIPLIDVPLYPQGLTRRIVNTPEEVCWVMKNLGFTTESWQKARSGWAGWECLAERTLSEAGEKKASIFFSMHGGKEGEIENFRFKFNLPPDSQGRLAYAHKMINGSVMPLFDFVSWSLPNEIEEKILRLTPFETMMDGVSVRLFEEFQSNQRVHLLFTMPVEPFPFLEEGGKVYTQFAEREKKTSEKVATLRTVRAARSAPIDWQPLEQDASGAILPEENASMDRNLVEPVESLSDDVIDLAASEQIGDEQASEHPVASAKNDDKVVAQEPETLPQTEDKEPEPENQNTSEPEEIVSDPKQQEIAEMPKARPDSELSEIEEDVSASIPLPVPKVDPTPSQVANAVSTEASEEGALPDDAGEARLSVPAFSPRINPVDFSILFLPEAQEAARAGQTDFQFEQDGNRLYSRFNASSTKKETASRPTFKVPDPLSSPQTLDFRALQRRREIFRNDAF